MCRKPITKIACIAGLSLAALSNVEAASISLNPQVSTVQIGSSFAVDLVMDFSDEATLGGGVDVNYDNGFAMFDSFTYDTSFLSIIDPLMTCPGAGSCASIDQFNTVSNIAFGNFNGIGGIFTVGTLEFTAIAGGDIDLFLSSTLGQAGPFVSATTFSPMSVTYNGATVSAVPLPASIWLMMSGLGLLGLSRKKKTL